MAARAPNRAVAALLAVLLSPGAAHAYVGLPRRGGAWLAVCVAAPAIAAALLPSSAGVGRGLGLFLVFLALALAWIGPTSDILSLPRARFGTTRWPAIAAFAILGFGAMTVGRRAVRAFLLEAFNIPGAGMSPTLRIGDHVFADKRAYRSRLPSRGDVAVFAWPEHPDTVFIKRVIGMPGDTIEAEEGHPIINGWRVPSCRIGDWSYDDPDSPTVHHEGGIHLEFLGAHSYLAFYDHDSATPTHQGPYRVAPGEVWVFGDNRHNSYDSRAWFSGRGGGVPLDLLRGRAIDIWLSERGGRVDWTRTWTDVDGAHLDASMASLREGLDACLRAKPVETMPPGRP